MSAEALRRAAALMRERAEDSASESGASDWWAADRFGAWRVRSSGGLVCADTREGEATHIASWHPGVALAVADWLESVAGAMCPPGTDVPDAGRHINARDEAHALDVARAYLGEATDV